MKTFKTKKPAAVNEILGALENNEVSSGKTTENQGDPTIKLQDPSFEAGQQAVKDLEKKQQETYDAVILPATLLKNGVPIVPTTQQDKIKIRLPDPEVGYNTAKITIYTKCGTTEQFDYVYENACVIVPTPPNDYNPNLDDDIESAYDDCDIAVGISTVGNSSPTILTPMIVAGVQEDTISEEQIEELFCPDIDTSPAGTNPAGTNAIQIGTVIDPIQLEDYAFDPQRGQQIKNGQRMFFSLDFSGLGSYRITVSVTDGNFGGAGQTLYHKVGTVLEIDQSEELINFSDSCAIPIFLNPLYTKLTLRVELLSPRETQSRNIFFDFNFLVEEPSLEPLNKFETDSNLTDSNKEKYIISSLVASSELTKESLADKNKKFIFGDLLRENYDSFWIKENQEKQVLVNPYSPSVETVFMGLRKQGRKWSISENIQLNEETVNITRDARIINFLDIVYNYERPYLVEEIEDREEQINNKLVEITPEYNFYYREYEELLSSTDIPEYILPNMYYLQLMDKYVKDYNTGVPEEQQFVYNDDFSKVLISRNTFFPPSVSPMALEKKETKISDIDPDIYDMVEIAKPRNSVRTLGEHLGDDYYEYFIDNYDTSPIKEMPSLISRSKNIVIPYSFLQNIEEFSKKDELYPMHIDIKFDTNSAVEAGATLDDFSYSLKNNYFGDFIFLKAINRFIDNDNIQQTLFTKQEFDGKDRRITTETVRHIDLGEIVLSETNNESPNDNFIFVGDYSEYKNMSSFPAELLEFREELREDLIEIAKQNMRTYKQMLLGNECYRETLFYRIAKYKGIPGPDTEIQNVWIPNDPDRSFLRYFDTQVKYGQEYTYRIYSYDMIVGNEYSIGTPVSNPAIGAYCLIDNTLKVILAEHVYKEFKAAIVDRPPTPPEIFPYTYKGVDNKVLFLLNRGTGTYRDMEINILEQDLEIFSEVRRSQMLKEDELIEFSGDDIIKDYEIFRTTTAPKSYEDFANSLYSRVSTATDKERPNFYLSTSSFLDNIKPNTKYYYTFRCKDVHDKVSNPGVVYQIEIINENGTIYPIVSTYDFPKEEIKQKTKSLKRFLMIQPNALQNYMKINTDGQEQSYTELQGTDKIMIGLQEESVYGKKYKMRLVSKNTNKVYDINFSFEKQIKLME